LYRDIVGIHLARASVWRPAIVLDLTKKLASVQHHAGAARFMVVELDKAAIAKLGLEIGDVLRQDMGMDVYAWTFAASLGGSQAIQYRLRYHVLGSGLSCRVPHALQVLLSALL